MIKAIIFDLDNTLVDFMKMKHMSVEAAASAMIDAGLNQKKDKIIKDLFTLYFKFGLEDKIIFQRYLKKTIGKVDYKILANGIVAYRRVRVSFLEPFPNVVPTLIGLKQKGLKLCIVSDAPRLKAWLRLCIMKIHSYFEFVVSFDDTKKLKPSKKPFQVALKKLKLKAQECIMVGDIPERDIKGANKLGMTTVFARYGNREFKGKTESNHEIADISQLLRII